MPEQKTHADSIRFYLTGALADGGEQVDPNLSIGNYRSSSEVTHLTNIITNPITNISVDFIAGANGAGSGALASASVNTLIWTPPSGGAGAAVTILNGETKILESAGDTAKFIRVTRNSAVDLSGTATLNLAHTFNNFIGMDNVSSAEATAGDIEYRIGMLKVESVGEVKNVQVYLGTLATAQSSGGTQLSATGGGSISLSSGNFNDWANSGFCRIENSLGALKEVVYYSSRTSTSLVIESVGRGLLGTAAQSGVATDIIHNVTGLRIGVESPIADAVQNLTNESSAPVGVTWLTNIRAENGLQLGDLASGAMRGLHIERTVVAGATAEASVLNEINWAFDAA